MHGMGTQHYPNASGPSLDKMSQNGSSTSSARPVIERGASWSYNETRILLALWGQDMVQRQLTNSKRTRHVWQKIAERIRENGYERTADQVRTRVFNMIAEYRRILKNPTPERIKKCVFFQALHKIYQAKDTNGLENVMMNYGDYSEQYNFDPIDFSNAEENGDCNGEDNSDEEDRSEMFAYSMSPNSFTGNLNDHNSNDDSLYGHYEEPSLPPPKRSRLQPIASHNGTDFPQTTGHGHPANINGVGNIDNSAFHVLIDRMFAHLSRETEVMHEWVNLERERLAQEIARRKEEKEREERREKSFLEVLTKLQSQVFTFLSKQTQVSVPTSSTVDLPAGLPSSVPSSTVAESSSSQANVPPTEQ